MTFKDQGDKDVSRSSREGKPKSGPLRLEEAFSHPCRVVGKGLKCEQGEVLCSIRRWGLGWASQLCWCLWHLQRLLYTCCGICLWVVTLFTPHTYAQERSTQEGPEKDPPAGLGHLSPYGPNLPLSPLLALESRSSSGDTLFSFSCTQSLRL